MCIDIVIYFNVEYLIYSAIEIKVHMYVLLEVLEEFYNIFGPELKSVTGDPKRIEDVVKRVDALVRPIEEVSDNELTQNSIIDTNTIYSLK